MAFDQVVPSEAKKPEREILDRHVKLVHGSADRIDRDGKAVIMADGSKIPYDYLVIATGSRPAPEQIAGLPEGGHIFYTEEGALKLRQALHDFNGGRIVVTVGVPHKCPVAPLEFTFMVQEWAKAKGIGDKTEVVYTYPIGRLHSLEPVAKWAAPVFEERHIESHVFFNPEKVDPKTKRLPASKAKPSIMIFSLRFRRTPGKTLLDGPKSAMPASGFPLTATPYAWKAQTTSLF